MFWIRKIVVGDAERAVLYRNRRFRRVLSPGVYRLVGWRGRDEVSVYDIRKAEYSGKDADVLIARLGPRLSDHFVLADLGMQEIGLLVRNGRIEDVLLPGTRTLYWRGLASIEVQPIPLSDGLEVWPEMGRRLRQIGVLDRVAVSDVVPRESVGLLFVDGQLVRTLEPGNYAFWNVRRNTAIETIDLRVRAVEVAGQELLTRDKVSLRVNLSANVRVIDPIAARTRVAGFNEQLYRELQFGLRKAVSSKTLDELLGDRASLEEDILAHLREKVGSFGVEAMGVGIKDVILPGEMKTILNGVVQAEKSAQANVIRRREEANATRSLLNTARLIEDSPILLRLKELEALEKITEKIEKLTVFGGLEGVMKQLVSIKPG